MPLSGIGMGWAGGETGDSTASISPACVMHERRMQKYLSSAFALELLSRALFGPRNGLLLFFLCAADFVLLYSKYMLLMFS